MSYCSRSRRRRFTALDFQSWAFNCIYRHFQQHFSVHALNGYFVNFRRKFGHQRSVPRPIFPHTVRNFGDLGTFSIDFCILYDKSPPYFYVRFVWPTDQKTITRASNLTAIISTEFEVNRIIHCRVIALFLMILYVTLWPVDLEQLSYMAVIWPTLSPSWNMPIHCWVMSYTNFHWTPLKTRTRPLHMRRFTWQVGTGSKTITFFGIPDTDLSVYCATSVTLAWR